jgi:methionyl-tRNA formyltransferase
VLEAGLDAGPILATGRTPLAADDDEDTLFFKTVALGAGLYADAIRAWQSGKAVPVPQRLDQGREYRFVDRTLTAELRVARLLHGGLLRRTAGR